MIYAISARFLLGARKRQVNLAQATQVINRISLSAKQRTLSKGEMLAIKAVWEGVSYKAVIAQQNQNDSKTNVDYSENYIRSHVARELWMMLTESFGEKITKTSLKAYLESHPELLAKDNNTPKIVGGYPPAIENFVGRQRELELLKKWSMSVQCVCIDGIAGIGKTCLAGKAILEIVQQNSSFEHYIWLPIHFRPTLNELIDRLMEHLGVEKGTANDQNLSSVFIQYLQQHRCLIVLDEVDFLVIDSAQQASEYEVFFRRIIEEQHQSCIWATANRFSEGLANYKNMGFPFESLHLSPLLPNEVQQLVESHGITFDADWERLVRTCMGNPLLLHSVLRKVSRVLGGQPDLVNQKTSLALNEFEYLLNNLFQNAADIKDLEITILCQIASIEREQSSISLLVLTQNIISQDPGISELDIFNSLERLQNHNLLSLRSEEGSTGIVMGDIIKKYISRNYGNRVKNIAN